MIGNTSNEITCDAVTGLRDWKTFFRDVERKIAWGIRAHVIFIQLLQLKRVNRKYGLQVGDRLLEDIGEYLEKLEEGYIAYRTNNSRFMLLGPECSQEKADVLLGRIRERFEDIWPIAQNGERHEVLAKAYFIHFFLEPKDTENDLLEKINHAASVFRLRERKGILFFNEELNADMLHNRYVMEEVRYAAEHKTFRIYYQPIYDCSEGRFVSAESLIRLIGRDISVAGGVYSHGGGKRIDRQYQLDCIGESMCVSRGISRTAAEERFHQYDGAADSGSDLYRARGVKSGKIRGRRKQTSV